MKILLLEGIPTSGKTTLSRQIAKILDKQKIEIIDENTTWMPLIDNKNPQIALDFLLARIDEFETLQVDYLKPYK